MAINLRNRRDAQSWYETDDVDSLAMPSRGNAAVRRARSHLFAPPADYAPGAILIWCVLRQALRQCHDLWADLPVVVAVRLPAGMSASKAIDAALRLTETFDRSKQAPTAARGSGCITVDASTKQRKTPGPSEVRREILSEMDRYARVVVLVEHGSFLPEDTVELIDQTVDAHAPTERLIEAVMRRWMRLSPSFQIIRATAALPFDVIARVLHRGTSVRQIQRRIERAAAASIRGDRDLPSGPSLSELPGMGDAAAWGKDLARDLEDWAAGRLPWSGVDRGILIHGKPGTGKTTYAKALARSCGVPLVAGSIAKWQATGHLGDMLGAMRKAFKEATEKAPSILFIDEMDSLGDRSEYGGENRTYNVQVVNGLLECLDGVDGREGVVVVAACNDPSRIDPAVTRSGRLDRLVEIPLPDHAARKAILQLHLGAALPAADLAGIARRTDGWTGADLERIVREARRRARKARRDVELDDLEASLPELVPVSPDDLWRAAVHESGHAVVACVMGHVEVIGARLERQMAMVGPGAAVSGGALTTRRNTALLQTDLDWDADLVVLLAGMAAEDVILKSRSSGASGGAGSDLHRATLLATRMEAHLGVGRAPMALCRDREEDLFKLLAGDRDIRRRVETRLADRYAKAQAIVSERKEALLDIATALVKEGRVSGDRIRVAIECAPGRGDVARGCLA